MLLLLAAVAVASPPVEGKMPPADVAGIEWLNAAQRATVDQFVREYERPTGECKHLAVRSRMVVRSSAVLRRLFPHSQFVVVPWIFQAEPGAEHFYSIPFGLYDVLAIGGGGRLESVFHSSGNQEEFGTFLHQRHVKVKKESRACEVAKALAAIYGAGLSACRNVRRGSSEWRLSYKEMPFRTVSAYEQVREAYYYRVTVDSNGVVLKGKLICETLERRKVDNRQTHASSYSPIATDGGLARGQGAGEP